MNNLKRNEPQVMPVEPGSIPLPDLYILRNGVPVYIISSDTEDIIRVDFIFKAGQIHEDLPLLSSSVNMMLTEGSLSYTSEQMSKKLDYYGAFINMTCEKDLAGLTIYALSRHFGKIMELSREILFCPLFPARELANLIKKRLQWYRINREKVQNLATEMFFESLFGKTHPYGRQAGEPDFGNITPGLLKDFHLKYYSPGNMTVIISGKISDKIPQVLENSFGDLQSGNVYIERSAAYMSGSAGMKLLLTKPGAIQSAIRIGSTSISKRHQDYPALKIVNTVLGGYFGSRLMKNLREEKGFTYGIQSVLSSLDLSGFTVISTETGSGNTRNVVDEIYKEISDLHTKPVEADELRVVRNYMLGQMIRMFDGPFALAESFRAVWQFGLDNSYYHRFAEKIKTISPDEIIELARTYYKTEELNEIIAGPL
ncbi:MAG: insulinase family protein [Bacteroidales bacterium]|nr:insulinase family protein [Bacteroidales bacterium]